MSFPMNHPFFVYGTLKPGEPNYVRFLAGRTIGEEPVSLVGAALYTAGPYPFLVMGQDLAAPDERVIGALITVADTNYATAMDELDSLEGYAEDGAANMYERLLVTVDAAAGPRHAWIYVAGAEALEQIRAGVLRKVEGGNWQSDSESRTYWSNQ
ncbi:gamma-glutamylcyclotransferase [Chloroflexales bacterium ZM16-3]|nr:gamma-glutamylcyclotransferase [Chloroflexales bacterium ZM16-3]